MAGQHFNNYKSVLCSSSKDRLLDLSQKILKKSYLFIVYIVKRSTYYKQNTIFAQKIGQPKNNYAKTIRTGFTISAFVMP